MTVDTPCETLRDVEPRPKTLNPMVKIRAVQVVLWLVVITGPVAAGLVMNEMLVMGDRIDALSTTVGVEVPTDTSGLEGHAELFVAAFLGASEDSTDHLTRFVAGVEVEGVAPGAWLATRTTSLGAREISPGYYAVVVAAEVATTTGVGDDSVWAPVGTRYFSVGVTATESGWAVSGLPTLIPAPVPSPSLELLVARFDGLASEPGLGEMLQHFLDAFLAGDGELTRFISPGASIGGVYPPPFVSIEILHSGLASTPGGDIEVVAQVRAIDGDGRTQILQYAIIATQRDGRWEVFELLFAPSLAQSETN